MIDLDALDQRLADIAATAALARAELDTLADRSTVDLSPVAARLDSIAVQAACANPVRPLA